MAMRQPGQHGPPRSGLLHPNAAAGHTLSRRKGWQVGIPRSPLCFLQEAFPDHTCLLGDFPLQLPCVPAFPTSIAGAAEMTASSRERAWCAGCGL